MAWNNIISFEVISAWMHNTLRVSFKTVLAWPWTYGIVECMSGSFIDDDHLIRLVRISSETPTLFCEQLLSWVIFEIHSLNIVDALFIFIFLISDELMSRVLVLWWACDHRLKITFHCSVFVQISSLIYIIFLILLLFHRQ